MQTSAPNIRTKKRSRASVRKEMRTYIHAIRNASIRNDGIAFRFPVVMTVEEAKAHLKVLAENYPNIYEGIQQ